MDTGASGFPCGRKAIRCAGSFRHQERQNGVAANNTDVLFVQDLLTRGVPKEDVVLGMNTNSVTYLDVAKELADLPPDKLALLIEFARFLKTRPAEDTSQTGAFVGEGRAIVKTPGVVGGQARIADTRLAVWGLEEWRRLGWSDDKLLDAYPQLTAADLANVWAYVAAHTDEIETAIRHNANALREAT